jgi:hypothetical protein
LQVAHWVSTLESTHGYSADEVTHIFWCLYTNWDGNSDDLKGAFPLTDKAAIEKDKVANIACRQALGLSPEGEAVAGEKNLDALLDEVGKTLGLNESDLKFVKSYFAKREKNEAPSEGDIEALEQVKGRATAYVEKQSAVEESQHKAPGKGSMFPPASTTDVDDPLVGDFNDTIPQDPSL